MDDKSLLEIISQLRARGMEWDTVDAKQTLVLQENGDKAEFIKDVIAMANNVEPSYIVVGLIDSTFADVGMLAHHYQKSDLNQMLSDKIDPPVSVDYREFSISGNEYALIMIMGENPPYIVARDIVHIKTDRKQVRVYKGMIFVRHGDTTEGISRSELEELLKKKSLRIEFLKETERALRLTTERPQYWEYLLTAELLQSNLALVAKRFDELNKGMVYKKVKRIPSKEFKNWASIQLSNLERLIVVFHKLFKSEFQVAWGPTGTPGNPIEIRNAVSKVVKLCYEMLDWEDEMRSTLVPVECRTLKDKMEGWAMDIFTQVTSIPDKILLPFSLPNPDGQHVLDITIRAPAGLADFMTEFRRIKDDPNFLATLNES